MLSRFPAPGRRSAGICLRAARGRQLPAIGAIVGTAEAGPPLSGGLGVSVERRASSLALKDLLSCMMSLPTSLAPVIESRISWG